MIDRVTHRKARQHLGILGKIDGIEVQIHVPAQRGYHLHHAVKHPHIGNAAEMADKIEPAAPETSIVKLTQLPLGDAVIDIGDRPVGAAAGGDGIERNAIVGAMHAGIDDNRAADAELCVQRLESIQRRVGRRVGPIRRVRIFRARAEDVAMRIAR